MSKPMLVTLPCILLLLDFWPLGRLQVNSYPQFWTGFRALVREKAPFFLLTFLSSIITVLVQRGAASSFEELAMGTRLINAVVAYSRYISKTVWPVGLAAIYPYARHLPVISIAGAGLLLAIITAVAIASARTRPYLIVGWLWFLGMLVPTIGLVQVGSQSMADRYMYVPALGLFIMVVWGFSDLMRGRPYKELILGVPSVAVSIVLIGSTRNQLHYWKNSEALFRRAINVTRKNYIAYDGLGTVLDAAGRPKEALEALRMAVQLNPQYPEAQYDLGTVLMRHGDLDEAITHFEAALRHNPKFAQAHSNLGSALLKQGKLTEAQDHFQRAVALNAEDAEAFYNLGTVWLAQSRVKEATGCLLQALHLKPDYWQAEDNLGIAFARLGNPAEASIHFAKAVRLKPDDPEARFNFGISLLELNQPAEAAKQFSEVLRLNSDNANAEYYLGLCLVRQQNFSGAAVHAEKARELAQAAAQKELAAKADELLKQARAGNQ